VNHVLNAEGIVCCLNKLLINEVLHVADAGPHVFFVLEANNWSLEHWVL